MIAETTKSTKLNIMGKSENFILTDLKGKGVFSRAFRVMELDGRKGVNLCAFYPREKGGMDRKRGYCLEHSGTSQN